MPQTSELFSLCRGAVSVGWSMHPTPQLCLNVYILLVKCLKVSNMSFLGLFLAYQQPYACTWSSRFPRVHQGFTKSPVNILLLSFTLKLFSWYLVKHTGKATSGSYSVKQLQLIILNKYPTGRAINTNKALEWGWIKITLENRTFHCSSCEVK